MKKVFLATLFGCMALGANAQNILFAMEPTYPPFESTDKSGKIVGFDVDIANAICKEIKADCHFSGQEFDALIPAVKSKKITAAISAIDITDARAKQVNFSQPYYDSSASFITMKGKEAAQIKTVGVQNGTTFQQYVLKETQYNSKSYASLQAAVLDLQNGRIDAIFGDTAVLSEWLKMDNKLGFLGDKVTNPEYFGNGLGIAVNKADTDLVNELNKGLDAIKKNGEYQKIYDKWFVTK